MPDRWARVSFAIGLSAFCLLGVGSGHHLGVTARLAALLTAVLALLVSIRALRHRSLVRGLQALSTPTEVAGTPVRVGDLGDAAFVAGLRHPTIYLDRRLSATLTPRQRRAVLLHEQAHQRALDPVRLLLLDLIAPLLRMLPQGEQWLAATLARREIAADRYALTHGATRADLAGALVALPPPRLAGVAGYTPVIDLRLRALLDGEVEVRLPAAVHRTLLFVVGGSIGAAACSWVVHDLVDAVLLLPCC
ncbi:MAG: M48 family metalloprotease [Nitriliruptoraceae bacterium]